MKLQIELKNPEFGPCTTEENLREDIKTAYSSLLNNFMPNYIGNPFWSIDYLNACVEYLTKLVGDKFLIGRGSNHIWMTALNQYKMPVKNRSAIITNEN